MLTSNLRELTIRRLHDGVCHHYTDTAAALIDCRVANDLAAIPERIEHLPAASPFEQLDVGILQNVLDQVCLANDSVGDGTEIAAAREENFPVSLPWWIRNRHENPHQASPPVAVGGFQAAGLPSSDQPPFPRQPSTRLHTTACPAAMHGRTRGSACRSSARGVTQMTERFGHTPLITGGEVVVSIGEPEVVRLKCDA